MTSNDRIPLRVSNKKAYIWDVDDLARLRSDHHICGMLTGTLPHLSQQNVFLGIPLVLMPEEVVLLVEKGLARLVDDNNAHHDPSISQLNSWDSARLRSIEQQLALAEQHDAKEAQSIGRAMSEEAIRKRKEREERRARERKVNPSTAVFEEAPAQNQPASTDQKKITSKDRDHDRSESQSATPDRSTIPGSSAPYTIQVTASSSTLDWYEANAHSFTTLAAAREAGIWDYPSTPYERARCAVFRDLWEQGYFMGGGIKFGGEYLVYPGDPLRYHSHFVATVIESPTTTIRPMEIVAHGRLGTGTKKAHLLCEWDEEKDKVTYYSIEWAGFG
ncbi:hypothetical protein F5I97DRAFT_1923809 [Phlebopus sp. FC_14]|nr:hypothetical protein F5I97DRAFT_1923809 [Phlebopus sp. FC_14]